MSEGEGKRGPDPVDTDGPFFHERGLTFEDLAVGDTFAASGLRLRKVSATEAVRLDADDETLRVVITCSPGDPVARFGDFLTVGFGLYVTKMPGLPDGQYETLPFNRLELGELFSDDGHRVLRKMTPEKAVVINPNSPLYLMEIGGH